MLTTRGAAPMLRVDGVPCNPGDVAVLPQREPFRGGLRWTLIFEGPRAAELFAGPRAVPSGKPSPAAAARLLDRLRVYLLRSPGGPPRFSLNTIDEVEAGRNGLRLAGTCSPIVPATFAKPTPAV
jgi:hypothetical protein